ncbi:MAG: hypothetical protein ACFCUG_15535 [Thiotrichales bacterium]
MEHRNYQRKSVRAAAWVRCHDGNSIPACMLNVGGEGAFLEVEGMQSRYQNHIEIEFPVTIDGVVQEVRWPALVIHRSPRGVGVLFLSEEGNIASVLRRVAQEYGVNECGTRAIEATPTAKVLPLRPRKSPDTPVLEDLPIAQDPCLHHRRGHDVVGG